LNEFFFNNINMLSIMTIGIIVIAVLVLIGIIVYTERAKAQNSTLRSIDSHFSEAKMIGGSDDCAAAAADAEAGDAGAEEEITAEDSREEDDTAIPLIKAEDVAAIEEEQQSEKVMDIYNTGKSGKVYSREELELQIRN